MNGAVNDLIPMLPNQSHSQILQVVSGTSNDFFNTLSSDVREQALVVIVDSLRKMSVPEIAMIMRPRQLLIRELALSSCMLAPPLA